MPMEKEAPVETSTKLKLWFSDEWLLEAVGDLCLCAYFTGSVMPFCLNSSGAMGDS